MLLMIVHLASVYWLIQMSTITKQTVQVFGIQHWKLDWPVLYYFVQVNYALINITIENKLVTESQFESKS